MDAKAIGVLSDLIKDQLVLITDEEGQELFADMVAARAAMAVIKPKVKDLTDNGSFANRVAKKLEKSQLSATGLKWRDIIDLVVCWHDVENAHALSGLGGCDPFKFENIFFKKLDSLVNGA